MSASKSDRSSGKDPHHERESARYDAPIASREHILATLGAEKAPMNLERLSDALSLTDDEAREALRRRVRAMIRDGQLIENRKQGLVPVDDSDLVAGRISAHKDGFGFLVPDEGGDDIFLNGKQMRRVLHGDRIVVAITGTDRRGRREGRIVDVVERANQSLVGRLVIEHGVAFVSPDNKRIHQDLMIQPDALAGAVDHDMVVAEIVEQPTFRQPPVGRVVEVLGEHLEPGMEIDVALRSHGIPSEWPEAVQQAAQAFSTDVEEDAKTGRKDVRELPLITIDGADARDFDDAVHCERLEDGWKLTVAIADVAHYVQPGAALDDEAIKRGTSVYFPGRVVPMLPEVLSNGLCSLNPHVDRLCMLCELTLDAKARPRRARFFNGVMRSHARLTYDQVNEMLTVADSPLVREHAALMPMIRELHALYKALQKSRRRRGAIEFESNETRIVFDDNRKISELVPVVRNDAHKLIEECMILANIAAAALLEKHEVPALYRVHAGPKPERLEDLRAFLALQGLTLGGGTSPSGLDYAQLARDIEDRADRHVIQTVMLRSMQQAVYQPKNEGHFGLALEQYAHFTSPIRRYPDLLVHRGIKHILTRAKAADYRYSASDMQAFGESCSTTERRAEEASRDVLAWLKCEYMMEHVGDEFPGVVTAVTSFGLFVELNGVHVEGLIHITNLAHDYYRYDSAAQSLVGERTGKRYRLGDEMVVSVQAVNLDERKIDFGEVSHTPAAGKSERVRRGKAKKPKRANGRERSEDDKHEARSQQKADRPVEASGSSSGGKPKSERKKSRGDKRKKRDRDTSSSGETAAAATAGAAAAASGTAPDASSAPVAAATPSASKASVTPAATNEKAASGSWASASPVVSGGADTSASSDASADAPAFASSVAKKSATKKRAAGKVTAKKTAAKVTAKKATAKKTAAKKTAAKKAAAKKTVAKKVAKKASAKKTASKKKATKKVVAKKTVARKTAAKKRASGSASGEDG